VIALDPGTITMIQGVGFLDLGTQFVSDTMDANVVEIRKLKNKFSGLEIHHVIHDNNMGADVLSKLGSDRAGVPPGVFVHELHHPSIKVPDQSAIIQGSIEPDREVMMIEVDWQVTFIDFIKEHKQPPASRRRASRLQHFMAESRVRFGWRQPIQAWISIGHTHKMCPHVGRQRNTLGDPRMCVRESCCVTP
jgi:hypothetical protein